MSVELRPVLLVEDEALTARITARAIKPRCPVVTASSIEEALRLLDEGLQPAGAILDYRLPEGVGLDLVEPLRARFAGIPIALLTGIADYAVVHEAATMEVTYLPKPYDEESLRVFLDHVEEFALWGASATTAQRVLQDLTREARLTPRMLEVLTTRLGSATSQEAADKLQISVHTLKSCVSEILRRTGFPKLAALAGAILRGSLSK